MARPVLLVLAGVNGAGKSSIGGHLLEALGTPWYNPDTFARELRQTTGCEQSDANAQAWNEGMRRLDQAMRDKTSFAFETTLGGNSVPKKIREAAQTHDVIVWFVGLSSPEQHIARVGLRVQAGGHSIPEAKIRERWSASQANLVALMPCLAELYVFDNSADVALKKSVPDATRVLVMRGGEVLLPDSVEGLASTPAWAKPLVEAALSLAERTPRKARVVPKRQRASSRATRTMVAT